MEYTEASRKSPNGAHWETMNQRLGRPAPASLLTLVRVPTGHLHTPDTGHGMVPTGHLHTPDTGQDMRKENRITEKDALTRFSQRSQSHKYREVRTAFFFL